MIFRKLFLIGFIGFAITTTAKNEVEFTTKSCDIKVEFYTPSIVRIVKVPTGHTFNKKSLVVIANPLDVAITRNGNKIISDSLSITVDNLGRITFKNKKGKLLLKEKNSNFVLRTDGADKGAYKVSQTFSLEKDEPVYGLGTIQNGILNRRNTHKLMEQSNLEDFQNVVQSIKGWGLYWDNYSPTNYDDDANGMSLSSEVGDGMDYYFMYGKNADGVISQMRHLSGKVPMFPLWTFGYWQSKERYKSSKEVVDVVDKYRELHVPLDGIIQDWQYWGSNYNWNAMEFLADDYLDGAKMIEKVHSKNAHLMISIWASFGPMTKAYKQLNEKGLLFDFQTWPQSGLTPWPPRMDYPSGVRVYDAFSQDARDIYWQNLKRLFNQGVDAWWMDSTDPDFFNATEHDYEHKAGNGTWRSLRNAFPLCTVGGVYDSQRKENSDKRVFIMTRSAFAGQQRYGSNMWSGDVASSWDMLRKQIPAGLNFSLTGDPNFNTDIGGFFCGSYNNNGSGSATHNPQYQELYVRWLQYGLFCPVFRSHGTDAPREIYQFGKKGEPIYDAIEKMINLRYRLLPYIYSTAWQVSSKDYSYMRPLFSDFASDRKVWNMPNEFMFGSSILAAPIVEASYTQEKIIKENAMTGWDSKEVNAQTENSAINFKENKTTLKYLPAGTKWFNFWTGKQYNGGQYVNISTSIAEVPMFMRAGSIIPLAPEMEYTGEKKWDNLEIRLYPGANGNFTLYEDEGDNYNYEKGMYATINFHWDDANKILTIGKQEGNYPGIIKERQFDIVTPNGKKYHINYNGSEIKAHI
ncbi:glycoside hydrolase family 31 protein [Prevotella sp.]|uniref:TIM-barrel domain-containing protein n=1 Tax=Prevotella sp. TaxID=59823 RepID=UPI003DA2FA0F